MVDSTEVKMSSADDSSKSSVEFPEPINRNPSTPKLEPEEPYEYIQTRHSLRKGCTAFANSFDGPPPYEGKFFIGNFSMKDIAEKEHHRAIAKHMEAKAGEKSKPTVPDHVPHILDEDVKMKGTKADAVEIADDAGVASHIDAAAVDSEEETPNSPSSSSSLPPPNPPPSNYPVINRDDWIYREHKIADRTLPAFASDMVQLLLLYLVCFCCPGLFNALNGLGAGGLRLGELVSEANSTLYFVFCPAAFVACPIANRIGCKWALALGTSGYSLYAGAFHLFRFTGNPALTKPGGAILGFTAGSLWAAHGGMMLSYPQEHQKGRAISFFWSIFNMGGVCGAAILLGENIDANITGSASKRTFTWILAITLVGSLLALLALPSEKIVRADGSRVIVPRYPTFMGELKEMWLTLRHGAWVILPMLPMFFVSNIMYTWQFNAFNAARFNVRARALNNLLFWIGQVFGPLIPGYMLDLCRFTRSQKAQVLHIGLIVATMLNYGWALWFERRHPIRFITELPNFLGIDIKDKLYGLFAFQYFCFAIYDALFQNAVYWYIGALTNSNRRAVNIVGFYKGTQSLGAAMFWRLDANGLGYMKMLTITWALLGVALILATPTIWFKIRDRTPMQEDLRNTGLTVEDVAPPELPDQNAPPAVTENTTTNLTQNADSTEAHNRLRFSDMSMQDLVMRKSSGKMKAVSRERAQRLDLEAGHGTPEHTPSNASRGSPVSGSVGTGKYAVSKRPYQRRHAASRHLSYTEGDEAIPLSNLDSVSRPAATHKQRPNSQREISPYTINSEEGSSNTFFSQNAPGNLPTLAEFAAPSVVVRRASISSVISDKPIPPQGETMADRVRSHFARLQSEANEAAEKVAAGSPKESERPKSL